MTQVGERLGSYFPFDEDVIDAVSAVADMQRTESYEDFLMTVGADSSLMIDGGAQIVDITPVVDHDSTRVRVLHQPMANPLDPNILYQAATVFASDPTVRTIITGNPSGKGYGQNLLNRADRKNVANGDLRPTIDAVSRYLVSTGAETVEHVSYSYGADRAAAAAEHAEKYDQKAIATVHIEPASVVKRSLIKLGTDFASTDKALKQYVNASDMPAFTDARNAKETVKLNYFVGLARLTNIAIARALAKGGFEDRMDRALTNNPELKSSVIWGTESELAIDGIVMSITEGLKARHGAERVQTLRIPGQKHAMANDIHLQAALVLQGLKS